MRGPASSRRVSGDNAAGEHFAQAVAENPSEPGYELLYGELYSGFRGARCPVTESAEDHYYRALEKLDALKAAGKYREYHAVVEEWVHKKLLVLYQEDGLPLLPWKAFPQHGYVGHDAPSLALSAQFAISKDTRDYFRNNEMRSFTSELLFSQSVLRANGTLTPRQKYDIVRAPLRYRTDERVRLRQNYLGALDFLYSYDHMQKGQILSYYKPAANPDGSSGTWPLVDTTVQQAGLNYERVIPLYPLFDFKLAGTVERVDRVGIVEFQPNFREKFWLYEARPSFSRFIGPDKVTLDLCVLVHERHRHALWPAGRGLAREIHPRGQPRVRALFTARLARGPRRRARHAPHADARLVLQCRRCRR